MESGSTESVHGQLRRILSSEVFARNERLSGFLRFVVEEELAGRGDLIKESIVGSEVFGRRAGYDVRQDSVVRTEAAKLRAQLAKYYAAEGAADPLVIELPKGGYRPVFRPTTTPPMSAAMRKPWLNPRWAAIAVGCLALLAAVGWRRTQQKAVPIPIAVLPLSNLSQDPADDYFADGLTSELIRNLSVIDGLAVRSQTSSFAFKGKQQDIREAGKQLDAEYILEGSVSRDGQQLRINARLVRVKDDFPLWAARYEEEATNVFAIQDKIARGIVNSLRLNLGRGRRRYEANDVAYDLYLRGRAQEIQTVGVAKSLPFFEQAIAKDPSFAPAYAGLAGVYVTLSGYDSTDHGWRADQMSRMRAAAEKARQLDPLLSEAHGAMGMVYARDAQWAQSEKSFRHAIELDPSGSTLRIQFMHNLLLPLGRVDEAIAQARLAAKSDPLSRPIQHALSLVLLGAGRIDEAMLHCPSPCVDVMLLQGRAAEAIPILEARFLSDLSAAGSGALGRAYALAGRREDAENVAARQWRPIAQAGIFAALGDKDRAFEALERAVPLGPVRLGRDLNYSHFSSLRSDPRVSGLRKKVGLPE